MIQYQNNTMRYLGSIVVPLLGMINTGSDATLCTDKTDSHGITNVLAMCREGTLTADRVIVDTYDTGMLDQDNCKCTVRLTGGGPVNLDYKAYPGTISESGCGSILRLTRHPLNTYTEYECEQINADRLMNFASNDLLNITLSRVSVGVQWKSGYCILIESDVNIAVTCSPGTILGTSTTGSSMTTTSVTMTTVSIPTMTSSTTASTTLSDARSSCRKCEQSTFPIIAVVVPVVVTLLVVVVVTVTNVILYRRRLTLMNELRTNSHGMYSVDSVHYDSLDRSRVEPPNAYEEFHRGQTYVNTAMGS